MAKGGDEYFKNDQRRVKILYGPSNCDVFPLALDFVRRVLFQLPARAFSPSKIQRWIEVILAANNKSDLENGRVLLFGKQYGFHFSLLNKQIQDGKEAHSRTLNKLRARELDPSTPDAWIRELLRRIPVSSDSSNAALVSSALDAACRYELSLYDEARNKFYDFAKHDSDWLDRQQLYYLADPMVRFVTNDGEFKHRTRGSSQADQILSFEDLKTMARSL